MNFMVGFAAGLIAMTTVLGIVQSKARDEALANAMMSVAYNQACVDTIGALK